MKVFIRAIKSFFQLISSIKCLFDDISSNSISLSIPESFPCSECRKPEGPARVLLGIAATHPEVFAH